jgi:hypothetical protein
MLTCGTGTRLENGMCVPESMLTCGTGTRLENGMCVPESMLSCGMGTRLENGMCVPISTLACAEGTIEMMGQCVSTALLPEEYESPLVRLQQLAGRNDHMHLDEVRYVESTDRLYVCSYDFAVVDVANPGNMRYLLQGLKASWPPGQGFRSRYPATGNRTGGCINLAIDGEYVYTTHRGNIDDPPYLGGWRIQRMGNTLTSTQIRLFAEPDTSYEGVDVGNGHLYVGLGVNGFAVYDHDRTAGTFTRRGSLGGLTHVLGLRVAGNTVYAADGLGGVIAIDVTNPDAPALLGRVATAGQARDVRVDVRANRTTVYAAATNAGLVVIDATNPASMQVIATVPMPSSAQRLDHVRDRVYVAAWNDIRVFDVTNPAMPRFIGAARMTRQLPGTTGALEDGRPEVTSRTLGIAASSRNPDIVFPGNWHVPYSYRIHADRVAPYIYLPEEVNLLDWGPVELGANATKAILVRNDGTAPLNVVHVWSTNENFVPTPTQVSIPPGGSSRISIRFTATSTTKQNSIFSIMSDDPVQPIRKAYLVANQPGLGVGKPLPETTVALVDGGEWSSTSVENTGKVQLLAYFATF